MNKFADISSSKLKYDSAVWIGDNAIWSSNSAVSQVMCQLNGALNYIPTWRIDSIVRERAWIPAPLDQLVINDSLPSLRIVVVSRQRRGDLASGVHHGGNRVQDRRMPLSRQHCQAPNICWPRHSSVSEKPKRQSGALSPTRSELRSRVRHSRRSSNHAR